MSPKRRAKGDGTQLVYYGWDGDTAWAFSTPEELGAWAAEHPNGTFDVAVRSDG